MSLTLDEFLKQPGAPGITEFRIAIGAKSDAQLRQWRYGYKGRRPGPAYCMAIEKASRNRVRCWTLRPDDWHEIWPRLVGTKGAPSVPAPADA